MSQSLSVSLSVIELNLSLYPCVLELQNIHRCEIMHVCGPSETVADKGEFDDNFGIYDVVTSVMSSVTALNHRAVVMKKMQQTETKL